MRGSRWHPTVSLAFGIALVAVAATAPGWWRGPGCAAAIAGLWLAWRRPPSRRVWMATGLVVGFVAFSALAVVAAWMVLPAAVPDLTDSLRRCASLGLRSLGGVWALQGIAAGHGFADLLAGARQLGAPPSVLSLLFLAHRHFFTYSRRLVTVRRALIARAGTRRVPPSVLGQVASTMLVHAAEQADALALALVGRGFSGRLLTRPLPRPPAVQALFAASVVTVAVICCWALGGR